MDAFLSRMNSTIIQWRTYLASLNGDILVLSNAKVDEFVAMVEGDPKLWVTKTCCHKSTYLHKNEL
jgi:hypothetical protein